MASSRPRTAGAAPSKIGSSNIARRLAALPAALLLALALVLPSTAVAEETSGYSQTPTTTSGYSQTPTTPATSTTPATTTTPKTGTLPAKEAEEPATTPTAETEPEKTTSTTPTTSTSPQASTLPFTGFDLSWDIGFGLVLIAAGFSILAIQRRQRRHAER
jgi:hypothetical protein